MTIWAERTDKLENKSLDIHNDLNSLKDKLHKMMAVISSRDPGRAQSLQTAIDMLDQVLAIISPAASIYEQKGSKSNNDIMGAEEVNPSTTSANRI